MRRRRRKNWVNLVELRSIGNESNGGEKEIFKNWSKTGKILKFSFILEIKA